MRASDSRVSPDLRVEALVATMGQTDHNLLDRMNIQTDAIVINQCERFERHELHHNERLVRFFSFPERGVGLSRNTALMRATGDICLFSDDDLIYRDGYEQALQKAFREHPDADVIVFNISSINQTKKRFQIAKPIRIRWFNYMRYGAARIAVRRASILREHISFSLLFGGGAQYASGEDTLFLQDCLKAGLHIYAVPVTLADIDDNLSTWFYGYNEKFLRDRGALHKAMFNRLAVLQNLLYLLRHEKVWMEVGGILRAWNMMNKGMRDFSLFGGECNVSKEGV